MRPGKDEVQELHRQPRTIY